MGTASITQPSGYIGLRNIPDEPASSIQVNGGGGKGPAERLGKKGASKNASQWTGRFPKRVRMNRRFLKNLEMRGSLSNPTRFYLNYRYPRELGEITVNSSIPENGIRHCLLENAIRSSSKNPMVSTCVPTEIHRASPLIVCAG